MVRELVGPARTDAIAAMLERIEGVPVDAIDVSRLAGDRGANDLKRAGYGEPLLVRYRANGHPRSVVFRTQSSNWYGHDRRADRAFLCLLAADTFGDQPRHVQVRDVGAIRAGELVSLDGAGEFFLVTEYVEGSLYAGDLRRIEQERTASERDVARVEALADHLVEVHARQPEGDVAHLRARATRDLVGSGEGMFGIVDGYPTAFAWSERLRRIEELAIAWRWRWRARAAPGIRRTHGDFHPYNILFRTGVDFTVLDASRGGVGDPADDLAALAINFLFAAMRCPAAWPDGFGRLWTRFFDRYFEGLNDERRHADVLDTLGAYFAWRALVLASPAWYPDIAPDVRRGLLDAAIGWLESERLDPASMFRVALDASASRASGPGP